MDHVSSDGSILLARPAARLPTCPPGLRTLEEASSTRPAAPAQSRTVVRSAACRGLQCAECSCAQRARASRARPASALFLPGTPFPVKLLFDSPHLLSSSSLYFSLGLAANTVHDRVHFVPLSHSGESTRGRPPNPPTATVLSIQGCLTSRPGPGPTQRRQELSRSLTI